MNKLKPRHAVSIGILFSLGSIIINMGVNSKYLIQNVMISFIISIFVILLYQFLLNNYPNKNLFQIIKENTNKLISKIIIILIIIILLINSVQIIYSFIDFITTINQLDFISKHTIMLLNFLLLGYILKNNIINIGRFSQVIFIITSSMIVLLFAIGLKDMNFNNLLPMYSFTKNDILNNLNIFLVQPFLEITILFNVFYKLENSKIKNNIFLIINSLSLILLILIIIESISLLGNKYTNLLNYPYYVAISCINMYKIVIRIEALSLIIFYFSSFMKLLFVIYNLILALKSIMKIKNKIFYPYLLLSHVLSLILYDNLSELKQFLSIYCIIYIIITVLIPLVIIFKKEKNNESKILKKRNKI